MDYNKALGALKSIIAQYGSNIIYDKESLPSLFKAAAPELTEEYEILKIFYDNGLYKSFSETSEDIADRDNTIRYLSRRLTSEFFVPPELTKEITDLFSVILGWDYSTENLDMREKAAGLINRVMNNKKKLYILSIIGAALVAAIIILVVVISDNRGSGKSRDIQKTTSAPSEHTEAPVETAEPTEEITEAPAEPSAASVEIQTEALAGALDAADDEYKSFEVLPVDSPDFFLNRNLRLVATLKDHQMSMLYDRNIIALYTDKTLSMSFKDNDGSYQKMENNVYGITDAVTTPGGRDCFMIAFGNHDLTDDNKEFNTDCFALVKMRDDIDMGDAKAEAYVLLIEDAMPDTYQILKIED